MKIFVSDIVINLIVVTETSFFYSISTMFETTTAFTTDLPTDTGLTTRYYKRQETSTACPTTDSRGWPQCISKSGKSDVRARTI